MAASPPCLESWPQLLFLTRDCWIERSFPSFPSRDNGARRYLTNPCFEYLCLPCLRLVAVPLLFISIFEGSLVSQAATSPLLPPTIFLATFPGELFDRHTTQVAILHGKRTAAKGLGSPAMCSVPGVVGGLAHLLAALPKSARSRTPVGMLPCQLLLQLQPPCNPEHRKCTGTSCTCRKHDDTRCGSIFR